MQTIIWGECNHDNETYFVGVGPGQVYKLCECVDETAAQHIANALHASGVYHSTECVRVDGGDE